MKIIRADTVGTIDMLLIKRPTNTAIGVNNYHIYANGSAGAFPAPVVRFLDTDPLVAQRRYNEALEAARSVFKAIAL